MHPYNYIYIPVSCGTLTKVNHATVDDGNEAKDFTYLEKYTYTCDVGYEFKSGDGEVSCQADGNFTPAPVCVDIDECTDNTDNCDGNATCDNNNGSFTCNCNNGYTGSGSACDPGWYFII